MTAWGDMFLLLFLWNLFVRKYVNYDLINSLLNLLFNVICILDLNMPVPKKKTSKKRKKDRASHFGIKNVPLTKCKEPSCGAYIVPHAVCPECGMYKERQVLDI